MDVMNIEVIEAASSSWIWPQPMDGEGLPIPKVKVIAVTFIGAEAETTQPCSGKAARERTASIRYLSTKLIEVLPKGEYDQQCQQKHVTYLHLKINTKRIYSRRYLNDYLAILLKLAKIQ